MSRKSIVSFAVSLLVSVLLLWWLLRQIDLSLLRRTLISVHIPALLVYMGIATIGVFLRAWRYKYLLKPVPIQWAPVLLVTLIRNLFVDLLPARLGSLSYIYVLNQKLMIPFQSAASSFVVAFVLDFLTLSPFLVVSLLAVGAGSTGLANPWLLLIALIFLASMMLLLWRLPSFTRLFHRGLEGVFSMLKCRRKVWALQALHSVDQTLSALEKIKRRNIYTPLVGISILLRMAKYGALYFLLYSLLHSHGFSLRSLSLPKTILGITGAEFTSILPVKGLAGFGTWETAWALAFKLMDFNPELAVLSGMGVHLISNLFEYSLGILALLLVFSPFIRFLRSKPAG
jgi:hypothetical protein